MFSPAKITATLWLSSVQEVISRGWSRRRSFSKKGIFTISFTVFTKLFYIWTPWTSFTGTLNQPIFYCPLKGTLDWPILVSLSNLHLSSRISTLGVLSIWALSQCWDMNTVLKQTSGPLELFYFNYSMDMLHCPSVEVRRCSKKEF